MAWREDLIDILPRLPSQFSLRDLYLLESHFARLHPENQHIKEKLRQTLQVLRDEGTIRFLDAGRYEKLVQLSQRDTAWPFAFGDKVSRDQIARFYQQAGPGGLGRGMFKPAWGKHGDKHMVLFHDEVDNPYGDVVEGKRILYVGEGQTGNQRLVGNNATLAKHLDLGVHVHYLTQLAPNICRYDGEMVVERWSHTFRPSEGRSVIEYVLVPAVEAGQQQEPVADYDVTFREVLTDVEPVLEQHQRRLRTYNAIVRAAVFAEQVIAAYERQCAVCGRVLMRGTSSELDAAHIVPIRSAGPNKVRNGLSLCKRHHWAFDNGVFSLTDEHRIAWLLPQPDPHDEVLADERIFLPEFEVDHPHPNFLRIHRKMWGLAT